MKRIWVAFVAALMLWTGPAFATDFVTPNIGLTEPTVGADANTWGSLINANLSIIDGLFNSGGAPKNTPVLRSYIGGLTLSTAGSSATFGTSAGTAADSTNVAMLSLASAFTKTTASWALGTAAGALDTGSITNNTWYQVYLIERPDTGVVDEEISLSATAPNLPSSYTLFRRIGAMLTDGSGNWVAFTQNGDEFLWNTPTNDVNLTNSISNTAVSYNLTVPTGVAVNALVIGSSYNTGTSIGTLISSLATADVTPTYQGGIGVSSNTNAPSSLSANVRTNTAAQIRVRMAPGTNNSLWLTTQGWIDRRGRDG